MTEGGGIVTMTYYGAEKVVPKYNVMGVAKAALEATVRYLSSELGGEREGEMLRAHAECAPLKRNVDPAEVGGAAVFLLSEASWGLWGDAVCGLRL